MAVELELDRIRDRVSVRDKAVRMTLSGGRTVRVTALRDVVSTMGFERVRQILTR